MKRILTIKERKNIKDLFLRKNILLDDSCLKDSYIEPKDQSLWDVFGSGEISPEGKLYLQPTSLSIGGLGKNWKEYVAQRISPILEKGGVLPMSVLKAPWGRELINQMNERGVKPFFQIL